MTTPCGFTINSSAEHDDQEEKNVSDRIDDIVKISPDLHIVIFENAAGRVFR